MCPDWFEELYSSHQSRNLSVIKVHLKELSCLLVGETSRLGVVLGERDRF